MFFVRLVTTVTLVPSSCQAVRVMRAVSVEQCQHLVTVALVTTRLMTVVTSLLRVARVRRVSPAPELYPLLCLTLPVIAPGS